jgi:hypothetical protein
MASPISVLSGGHRRRLRGGNQSRADGAEFDRLETGALDGLLARRHLAESASRYPPLDVVRAFGVNLDLAVDAHLVLEASVRFGDHGSKAPLFADFDFLEEVDAVRVFGSVAMGMGAGGLQSRH